MLKTILVASATLLLLASTTMEAGARRYHRRTSITGRTPNYSPGLGLRKQTRTGGPAGGQTGSGGGS